MAKDKYQLINRLGVAQNVCGHKTWLTTDPHSQPIAKIKGDLIYSVKELSGWLYGFGVVDDARQNIRSVHEELVL